jgi:DNA-binding LytR/AlgR family response regulator
MDAPPADTPPPRTEPAVRGPRDLRVEFAVGFAYWLGFLVLLQPGNLVEMARGGVQVPWAGEALRIAGAAALGGAVTPLLFTLSRRFPIEGRRWRRHVAVHAAALPAIAIGLILIAHVLADIALPGRDPRLRAPLDVELAANGALLLVAVTALAAVIHAVAFFRRAEADRAWAAAAAVRTAGSGQVPVKTRGGVILVRIDEIDWVESQGNYIALHCGPKVHLVRDTLSRFERRLDPQSFVRIHRGTIVRADRVRSLTHLSNGDGLVLLEDGTELRSSRSYREAAGALFSTHAEPGANAGPAA